MILFEECSNCEALEERVFVDSWTGLELCLACLGPIVNQITNSPGSEPDNLKKLLEMGL